MPTEFQELEDFTVGSRELNPPHLQPSVTSFQPTNTKISSVERISDSTTHATFTPHPLSSSVKAKVKHLEDGFPTIKGDPRHIHFVSHYNDTFRRVIGPSAKPVEKHSSCVYMGNPATSLDRKTTSTASYGQPIVSRLLQAKDQLVLQPKHLRNNSWTTTFREDFKFQKPEPVVQVKQNQNISSVSIGDADSERNAERMSVTTNNIFFSNNGHISPPCLPDPDMVTKSQVEFGPTSLSSYSTTTSEHYCKKEGDRARPVSYPRSNILTGPERGPYISTSQADYVPLRSTKQRLPQTQQKTNVQFPLSKTQFSTTNKEDYTAKPSILQRPACNQFSTHFML